MRTSDPPLVAVVTAALFRGRNLVALILVFVVCKVVGLGLVAAGIAGVAAYAVGIGQSTSDRMFLAEVEERRRPLMEGTSAQPQLTSAPGLSGKYRASLDRVRGLKETVERDVKALPTGPLTDQLADFLPQLSEVMPEVAKLLAKAQAAEAELTGPAHAALTKEVAEVDAKLTAATDPEVREQLGTALSRKQEALAHMESSRPALARIDAQVEAIASGLQEAHARLTALSADAESLDASPARQAVEGISRDVKYLAQAVSDTEKLLAERPANRMRI